MLLRDSTKYKSVSGNGILTKEVVKLLCLQVSYTHGVIEANVNHTNNNQYETATHTDAN